jgi:hypothetical protein
MSALHWPAPWAASTDLCGCARQARIDLDQRLAALKATCG